MVKHYDKNKKVYDDLSLVEDAILKDELKAFLKEPFEDFANLKIENDNDFKLMIKESTSKPTTSKNTLKFFIGSKCGKPINMCEVKETFNNEIIDIKCKQKASEQQNRAESLQSTNEVFITKDTHKSQHDFLNTDEIKNDLQSLLIMMTISSTCNDGDKEDEQLNVPTAKSYPKNQNNQNEKIETLEDNYSTTDYEISDILKIEELKVTSHNVNIMIRKYANKWMDYVKRRRKKIINRERLQTINNFFDKLEKKKKCFNGNPGTSNKAKLQVRDYNTYQHRYRVQKHIIALQKAKLEQQNKLIEELKYNKIVEASRQSLDYMKEDVRKTYYEVDKHLKPKIKCLTNELKIREIEVEDALVLHCLKVPQFLQRMEARAREREEKHAIIRERRKQMEEERIRLKQQAELAKAEMDKEEKAKRIKELREKRKREKVENIRKKQYAERLRALIVMADLHYEKTLTAKYGLRPLKLLIEMKRDSTEKANAHFEFQLKKNIFLHWMWYTEDMWYERNYKAEDFCRKKLLKKAFSSFKKNHEEYVFKIQVAKDYYDLYITQLVFKKFKEGILLVKKEFNMKWNNTIIYYNRNLLFKTLTCWRTLPALNALKREQDARKLRWREKVLQVVPDYAPPDD